MSQVGNTGVQEGEQATWELSGEPSTDSTPKPSVEPSKEPTQESATQIPGKTHFVFGCPRVIVVSMLLLQRSYLSCTNRRKQKILIFLVVYFWQATWHARDLDTLCSSPPYKNINKLLGMEGKVRLLKINYVIMDECILQLYRRSTSPLYEKGFSCGLILAYKTYA